ncbi:hypothetical protein P3W33_17940 [Luteibacter sp. PPL552]
MNIDPVCSAVRPMVHSWPFSIYWWLSLSASDQGAWVSGVGAFVASGVALFVAYMPRRWRTDERRQQARLIAKLIVDELDVGRSASSHMCINLSAFRNNRDLANAVVSLEGFEFLPTPMIDKFVDRLDCFDSDSLQSIALGIVGFKNAEARLAAFRQVSIEAAVNEALYAHIRSGAIEKMYEAVGEAAVALGEAITACNRYGAVPSRDR